MRAGEPDTLPQLARRAWRWGRGFWGEFTALGSLDRAAALTYYAVLSLAPALVVGVSLLGLVGAGDLLLDQLGEFAPGPARETFEGIVRDVSGAGTGSGLALFGSGLVIALWSASGYVGAFGRASRAVTSGSPKRSGWWQIGMQLAVTLAMFVLLFAIAAMLVVSGPLADHVAKLVGLGSDAPRVWALAKWPILLLAMTVAVSLLFSTIGAQGARRVRLLSRGGLVAVALWVVLSAGFSFYVTRFGNYSRVYGSLAGVVIFLVWLWLSNVALLIGVMVEARRARRRATVVI